MQVRDPRTVWVSPCGEYAIALCEDIPRGVVRMSNHRFVDDTIASYENHTFDGPLQERYLHRTNNPNTDCGYYAVCRRLDLPWEFPVVPSAPPITCPCGARVPVAIAAIGGRHLCK